MITKNIIMAQKGEEIVKINSENLSIVLYAYHNKCVVLDVTKEPYTVMATSRDKLLDIISNDDYCEPIINTVELYKQYCKHNIPLSIVSALVLETVADYEEQHNKQNDYIVYEGECVNINPINGTYEFVFNNGKFISIKCMDIYDLYAGITSEIHSENDIIILDIFHNLRNKCILYHTATNENYIIPLDDKYIDLEPIRLYDRLKLNNIKVKTAKIADDHFILFCNDGISIRIDLENAYDIFNATNYGAIYMANTANNVSDTYLYYNKHKYQCFVCVSYDKLHYNDSEFISAHTTIKGFDMLFFNIAPNNNTFYHLFKKALLDCVMNK